MTALKLTLEHAPFTPLIIVTGSQNEDIAVGCIKAGAASDYVLKDSIRRLGPAVADATGSKACSAGKGANQRRHSGKTRSATGPSPRT